MYSLLSDMIFVVASKGMHHALCLCSLINAKIAMLVFPRIAAQERAFGFVFHPLQRERIQVEKMQPFGSIASHIAMINNALCAALRDLVDRIEV